MKSKAIILIILILAIAGAAYFLSNPLVSAEKYLLITYSDNISYGDYQPPQCITEPSPERYEFNSTGLFIWTRQRIALNNTLLALLERKAIDISCPGSSIYGIYDMPYGIESIPTTGSLTIREISQDGSIEIFYSEPLAEPSVYTIKPGEEKIIDTISVTGEIDQEQDGGAVKTNVTITSTFSIKNNGFIERSKIKILPPLF